MIVIAVFIIWALICFTAWCLVRINKEEKNKSKLIYILLIPLFFSCQKELSTENVRPSDPIKCGAVTFKYRVITSREGTSTTTKYYVELNNGDTYQLKYDVYNNTLIGEEICSKNPGIIPE